MSTTTPAPGGTSDPLADLVPGIRQRLEQGEADEARLDALLKERKSDNSRLRQVLKLLDPELQKGKQTNRKSNVGQSFIGVPRASGTATGFGISMEKAKRIADEILRLVDGGAEFVSQPEIYKALNMDQGAASAAFRWFRSIEFLRKAGRDPGSSRERWAVINRDAVDRAIAETEAAHE